MRDIIIPPRLNGYEIIAAMTPFDGNGDPIETEAIILGHDPCRRTGKYVTACYKTRQEPTPSEWYIGHYFETLDEARFSLIRRATFHLDELGCKRCEGRGTSLNAFGLCDACVIDAARTKQTV